MPFGFTHPNSWLREDDDFDRYNKPGSPDWFSLSGDVGFAQPNNRHDAMKVESLLGHGGYLDHDKGGGPLGLSSRRLEEPIKAFQKKNGLKVDGLMRPNGPTIGKMKELYGGVFGRTPAPTPAMVDAHVARVDAGEEGFLWDGTPPVLPRPNARLDAKTALFEYARWNRDWARNAHDSASFAKEYETYIRDPDETHGHDPGLVFARDFTRQVEALHGNGGAFAKKLLNLLDDRPDLQREYLGGPVPTSPPVGTFKPGGLARVQQWIDDDRVANGVAPRYRAAAPEVAPIQRVASTAPAAPDPKNLLEYGQNFGLPEDWALAQQPPHQPDLPNPRPAETHAREVPATQTPQDPTNDGGAVEFFDPNEMKTEGVTRLSPPDNSRGFADEFPAPSPRERDRVFHDFSRTDEAELERILGEQTSIRSEAEGRSREYADTLIAATAMRERKIEELAETFSGEAAKAAFKELADALKSGDFGDAGGKLLKLGGRLARTGRKAVLESSPQALAAYQALADEQRIRDLIHEQTLNIRDSEDLEVAIRKELEGRREPARGRE